MSAPVLCLSIWEVDRAEAIWGYQIPMQAWVDKAREAGATYFILASWQGETQAVARWCSEDAALAAIPRYQALSELVGADWVRLEVVADEAFAERVRRAVPELGGAPS